MIRLPLALAIAACAFSQVVATPSVRTQGKAPARPVKAAEPARATAKPGEKTIAAFSPRDLKYPPLHAVRPPELVTAALPNGLKIYLAEDRELPVIGGVVMVRTGSAVDPPERIGIATMAGILLRSGGTAMKTGELVDATLTRLGMTLDTAVTATATTLTFVGLARNAADSLAFLREILVQPEFRQDRLEQAKAQLRDRVTHRNDDLAASSRRELSSLIFGKDSPYGWLPDYAGIDRITRTDLKNFHTRYFFPANTILGIWGDFDANQMKTQVEKIFGDWPPAPQPPSAFPAVKATPAPGIYLGERKDAQVTYLAIGQPSGTVAQPDYPALEVMGLIFNQLQARITQRARSPQGTPNLSLLGVTVDDVKATWGADFDHPGVFRISGTCRGPAAVDTIRAIRDDLEQMRTVEVGEEELRQAKDSAIATLASHFDTRAEACRYVMTRQYYGLPADFAQRYQAGIMAVTGADVLRVAKQYLKPAEMTTIVIGNPQVFSTPLESLNPQVNRIDLTIPEPKPAVTETTDASIAQGKRLLERAQAAVGGADKLAAVKDYQLTSEYQLDPSVPDIGGYKVPQTDRWISPIIFRQDIALPTGRISAYSDGKAGWIVTPQGWGALVGIQLKQLQSDLFRSYFRLLLSDRVEGRTVNAVDQFLVEITDTAGELARIEFDPKSGMPARATYDVPQATGAPLFTEEAYGDFREVAGIRFPFRTVIIQGGKKFADVVVTDLKINSGLRQVDLALRPQ